MNHTPLLADFKNKVFFLKELKRYFFNKDIRGKIIEESKKKTLTQKMKIKEFILIKTFSIISHFPKLSQKKFMDLQKKAIKAVLPSSMSDNMLSSLNDFYDKVVKSTYDSYNPMTNPQILVSKHGEKIGDILKCVGLPDTMVARAQTLLNMLDSPNGFKDYFTKHKEEIITKIIKGKNVRTAEGLTEEITKLWFQYLRNNVDKIAEQIAKANNIELVE